MLWFRGLPYSTGDISALAEKVEKTLSAENMKAFLKEKVKGPLKFHHEFRISISGCPNACSRPQIVDIGIIGVSTPIVNRDKCDGCGECQKACAEDAIHFIDSIPEIDESNCLLCGQCERVCNPGAMEEKTNGFKILIGGKLGRHPRLAMEIPGIFNMEEAVDKTNRLISYYKENCVNGERFGELLGNNQIFDLNQGDKFLDDLLCCKIESAGG